MTHSLLAGRAEIGLWGWEGKCTCFASEMRKRIDASGESGSERRQPAHFNGERRESGTYITT